MVSSLFCSRVSLGCCSPAATLAALGMLVSWTDATLPSAAAAATTAAALLIIMVVRVVLFSCFLLDFWSGFGKVSEKERNLPGSCTQMVRFHNRGVDFGEVP